MPPFVIILAYQKIFKIKHITNLLINSCVGKYFTRIFLLFNRVKSQDFPNKKWLYVSVQVIPLRRDTSPTRAGPVLHLNFSFPAGAIENKCREFRRFGITFVSGISFQRCPILAKRPVFLHGERTDGFRGVISRPSFRMTASRK